MGQLLGKLGTPFRLVGWMTSSVMVPPVKPNTAGKIKHGAPSRSNLVYTI